MSRARVGKAALGPEEGRRVHVMAENHTMNLAGPRPLSRSVEAMDLGFALQAQCLDAAARRPVGAESRVVHVPRDIDKTVASAYVAMARLGSAAA